MNLLMAHLTGPDTGTVFTALVLGMILGSGLTLRLVRRPKSPTRDDR